jgi:hypothetical protein
MLPNTRFRMIPFPPRSVLLPTMGRTILIWALLKVVFAGQMGSWVFTAPASMWLALAVGAMIFMDLRVFRDRVFLANLGVPRRSVVVVAVGVAMILEAACTIFLTRSQTGP